VGTDNNMLKLRDVALLGGRCVLGGYLAVHGSQKLFGAFEGPGLERAGKGFEARGLVPGRESALLAGATELAGGMLTIFGVADPIPQFAIAGTMAVAALSQREKGPLNQNGGFELALTNGALATVLAAVGPGKLRLAPRLPRLLTIAAIGVGGALLNREIRQLLDASRRPQGPELQEQPPRPESRERLRIGPVRTAGV
jgi:putative oxidoreductase